MSGESQSLDTVPVAARRHALAPDGSEIRILAQTTRGSMVHCTLPPGGVSRAVAHHQVEELWYCLSGQGEVWRQLGQGEEIVAVSPGWSLSIPTGARFQFRNTGDEALAFVIVTLPPWPGEQEAFPVEGVWQPTVGGEP
ncbi:MAG: cupin domain-containing protein [Anaerolineae bacterium]|nr:cupin domain-containing protein [Anaerolineae bacterium]